MLPGRTFLEATGSQQAPIALLGLPFDGSCSFRAGARFGPGALRDHSWVLEDYSPDLDRELDGKLLCDAGDLELPMGNAAAADVTVNGVPQGILGGPGAVLEKEWRSQPAR